MRLLPFKTRWFSSRWFLLLGAVVGLPILGTGIWLLARWLSRIPNQNWQEVASISQAITGVLTLWPILWAVLRYRSLAEDQRKAKHYQAWQAITDAQGKPGSGGRRTALEDLHGDGVLLVGVDLSGGAYLENLKLPEADLSVANLAGANLTAANLRGAFLLDTNFQGAYLLKANLQGAYLPEANFQGADLAEANLQEADLPEANFQEAKLAGVNLQGANLTLANLSTSRNLTREQILSTRDWRGAVLPPDLKDLELLEDSPEEELNRLGRTWKRKPTKEPE